MSFDYAYKYFVNILQLLDQIHAAVVGVTAVIHHVVEVSARDVLLSPTNII